MDVGYLLKVAPAPPSCWASLTLDVGYLLRAAPAPHSHVNQYWPTCSCILAWRTLLPDREAWQATVSRVSKSRTLPKRPHMQRHKTFFACGSSAPELRVKMAQLLGLRGPWQHQVCRDTDCLHRRSYGPIRVFLRASCSWRSEGLFGQSFSVAPLIQALRGLPCLGTFSVVWHIRHI